MHSHLQSGKEEARAIAAPVHVHALLFRRKDASWMVHACAGILILCYVLQLCCDSGCAVILEKMHQKGCLILEK